jgi:TetR/AcrR family transcriptional regulator, transcriptional repressor for nem operon
MPRHKEFDPDQVMQEAMEAFWERGYNATSVNDLLAEMNLNRGSLYGTFGDKKQLFLAALDKYDQQGLETLKEILDRPGSARSAIRELVFLAADNCTGEFGRRGCLAAKAAMELAPRDKDVAAWLKRVHKRNETLLAETLRRGQEQGEFDRRLDPHAAARLVLISLMGLKLLGTASPSEKEVHEVAKLILRALE